MPTINNYNLSNFTGQSGNSLINFVHFTSQGTNYAPGLIIWISLYIIIFLGLKIRGASILAAFAATNFAIFLVTLLMYSLTIINSFMLVLSIVLLPISILLLFILE